MKKAIIFVIAALLLIGLFCHDDSSSSSSSYDDAMAGYDWGDHSYYNRENHQVEWTPWK
ncbi:MAG: hypothetical protein K6F64_05755 [Clostridia bacterium]|nr:hypothetical protein [Clostridia bacterium]